MYLQLDVYWLYSIQITGETKGTEEQCINLPQYLEIGLVSFSILSVDYKSVRSVNRNISPLSSSSFVTWGRCKRSFLETGTTAQVSCTKGGRSLRPEVFFELSSFSFLWRWRTHSVQNQVQSNKGHRQRKTSSLHQVQRWSGGNDEETFGMISTTQIISNRQKH